MKGHAVGCNILPRNEVDWIALEAHYARHRPALSVVFLEPPAIERLRQHSPDTLYIYRDAIPGDPRGNDDDAQDRMDAIAFVDMLHAKAPPGAALYLGNEPTGNWGKVAAWTVEALNRCDQLGRIGVALNLSYGNPKPEDWKGALKPVLDRLAGTRHILGLHEYWAPGNLGDGYWTNRWNDHIPDAVQVGLTEIGALKQVTVDGVEQLDARTGWTLLPGYSAAQYGSEIRQVIDKARLKRNFRGAALFCVGKWHGCEVNAAVFQEMEQYAAPIIVQSAPDVTNWQPATLVTFALPARLRQSPDATPEVPVLARIPAGTHEVLVDPDGDVTEVSGTRTYTWKRIRYAEGGLTEIGFVRSDAATVTLLTTPEPQPEPEPEPEPQPPLNDALMGMWFSRDEVMQYAALLQQQAALQLSAVALHARMAQNAEQQHALLMAAAGRMTTTAQPAPSLN